MRLILLPGMDGTGQLFARFQAKAPPHLDLQVIAYPSQKPQSYAELQNQVALQLPQDGTAYWILAESYSGPLAVTLAASAPRGLMGLILVASFLQSPLPHWIRLKPPASLFRVPPSAFILRQILLGKDADDELVGSVRRAIRSVNPDVMRMRAWDILRVDASAAFQAVRVPLYYIEGRQDRVVKGQAKKLAALRPDLRVLTVDGPHLLLQRRPQEVWEILAPVFEPKA